MATLADNSKIIIELDTAHVELKTIKEEVERIMVERMLRESGGNLSRAARHLGISRPKLYGLMLRYGMSRD